MSVTTDTNMKLAIAKLIEDMGMTITLQRADVDLGKTYGAFATTKITDLQVRPSTNVKTSKTMYITAVSKLTPTIGDYVVLPGGDEYYVTAVDEYKPAGTAIAYKCELT
jgi:hypothetical protein